MAEAKPNSYVTELEGLRAPLGVLLYLIRRENVDIYDIPIARITRDYLQYLDTMEQMEIDLAGEFFVLAATLMRIKAQMLLRKDDDTEEDPRAGLVRSLLEYKKMMEAARTFREIEEERYKVFTRPVPEREKSLREEAAVDLTLYQLMKAFREIMNEFEEPTVREIELEEYTIEEKITAVREWLRSDGQVEFRDLFAGSASRMELIVTLMALLELIKHGQVKVNQETPFGPVWIFRGNLFDHPIGDAASEAAPEDSGSQPTGDHG